MLKIIILVSITKNYIIKTKERNDSGRVNDFHESLKHAI